MNKKGWIVAMLGAAAMAASSGALAQRAAPAAEAGWYATGAVGMNDDFDDETTFRFAAGYQVNRNLSVELGYINLGEFSAFGVNTEASAFEVIGLYKFPVANKLSVYGLAGLARIEVETSGTFFGVPVSGSDDSIELTLGIGVQYDITPKFAVRGQYQDYDGAGVMSVGVVYKF